MSTESPASPASGEHAAAEPPKGWHVSLKTVGPTGLAYNDFQWPIEGPWPKKVECPDWNDRAECGGGLHLLERGEGDGDLLNWSPDAVGFKGTATAGDEGILTLRRWDPEAGRYRLAAGKFVEARP